MKPKNRTLFISLVLFLSISLMVTACNLPSSEPPTEVAGAIETAVAATLAAQGHQVQPSATAVETNEPASTSTATPAAACNDAMNLTAWKRDNAVYDAKAVKTPLAPTTPFTISWTFQNTGTCTWDADYRMMYESGEGMTQSTSYPIVSPGQKVAPGESVTAKVDMIAPGKVGPYKAIWRLQSKTGSVLGTYDVQITVGNASAHGPARPEDLTYTFECTDGGISITLTWTDVAGNEDGYRIYRDGEQVKDIGADSTSYTDSVARIKGYYTYNIVAFNASGESLPAVMAAKNAQSVCTP